jgi:hypothetical protein
MEKQPENILTSSLGVKKRRRGLMRSNASKNSTTRKQTSLRTKDEAEAVVLLNAKNESFRQPVLNVQIARAYLTAGDPAFAQRAWQSIIEHGNLSGQRHEKAGPSEKGP